MVKNFHNLKPLIDFGNEINIIIPRLVQFFSFKTLHIHWGVATINRIQLITHGMI